MCVACYSALASPLGPYLHVKAPRNAIEAFLRAVSILPSVPIILAEPNQQFSPQSILHTLSSNATDQLQALAPWHLDRIDQLSLPLNGAYTYGRTGKNVNVYVIDTGIATSLSEFEGRAVKGFDAFPGKALHWHGTHVAAIIASRTYGVAKAADVVSVRMLDENGNGDATTFLSALAWVRDNAVRPAVVSLSVGGYRSPSIDSLLRQLLLQNYSFISAAGNDADDACKLSSVIDPTNPLVVVGASNVGDRRLKESNLGPCVSVFAPGHLITSIGPNGEELIASGTSQAAPVVAGIAALLLEDDPSLTPAMVKSSILSAAIEIIPKEPDTTRLLALSSFPTALPDNYTSPYESASGSMLVPLSLFSTLLVAIL